MQAYASVVARRLGLSWLRQRLDALPDTNRPRAWLIGLCLLLFLPGFFAIQPLDLGETEIALATRRMLDAGAPFGPWPPGAAGLAGPLGIHWLQAALVRGLEALHLAHRFGIPAYRLASLLGAVLAVLATHHWGRALVGRRAAFLGAAMLAGCAAVVAEAHLATAEAPLLAAVTAAMGLFGAAYLAPRRFTAPQAAGFWLATGAGLLLGGPVAPLVPLLAGVTLAAMDRGAPWLPALRPAWGLPILVAAALPWPLGGGGPVPDLPGDGGLPGLHLLTLAATAFPATYVLLPALPGIWRDRTRPATRLLLAWAVPSWLLLEALAPRLGAILPVLPPLMLLGAAWAADPRRPRVPPLLLWAAGLLLAAVAGAAGYATLKIAELDLREAPYTLLTCLAGALLVWRLVAHGRSGAWARAALLGTVLATPLYAALLAGTLSHLPVARIAARIAGMAQSVAPGLPPERFGVLGFDAASLRFTYGSGLQVLPDGAAAVRFLGGAPGRVVAVADRLEREFRIAAAAGGLAVHERAQIISYDPIRRDFVIMIYYDAPEAAAPG